MKKMIFTIFCTILFSSSNAFAIDVIISSNKNMECAKVINHDLSVGNRKYFANSYSSSNQRAISNYNTSVEIWTSNEGVLSDCLDEDDWKIASNYSPGNNEWVIAFGANCTLKKAGTVQFTYNTANFLFLDKPDKAIKSMKEYEFTYHPNVEAIEKKAPKKVTKNNVHLGELSVDKNICHEINVR